MSRNDFLKNPVLGVAGDGSKIYQEIVKILKEAGIKMDIPEHDGITPLRQIQRL